MVYCCLTHRSFTVIKATPKSSMTTCVFCVIWVMKVLIPIIRRESSAYSTVGIYVFIRLNAVEVFHRYGVHLSSLSWCSISSPFRENNNVVLFPFLFHNFMLLASLWFIRLQRQFSILRTRICPDLYPLICPPRRPFALGTGKILIPGFILLH